MCGAVFADPAAEEPYLFHLALISIVRDRDQQYSEFSTEEVLNCRLVGVKQFEGSQIVVCPVEHLLLKGGHGLRPAAQRLALAGNAMADQARAFLMENDCATPSPRLVSVQDPFGRLLGKAKGSVMISSSQIMDVAAR